MANRSVPQFMLGAIANVTFAAPETLSGALTLTYDAYNANILKFDPGGASRNVTLWPEESSKGMWALVVNAADAAENLVLKDDAASPSTIATVNQNEAAIVACNGTAWTLICIITIALS